MRTTRVHTRAVQKPTFLSKKLFVCTGPVQVTRAVQNWTVYSKRLYFTYFTVVYAIPTVSVCLSICPFVTRVSCGPHRSTDCNNLGLVGKPHY